MSKETVTMTEAESSRLDFISEHRRTYIQSGGAQGHILSMADIGGLPFTTTLLLKTVGRKSGQARILPLIYGATGGEVVIIASKGGADIHPAWYLNMLGGGDVAFQIGTQAFKATWREAQGAEREAVWAFMENLFPPYKGYKAGTDREIPVILLTAGEEIAPFTE